jgi:hypothetical protein
MAQVVISLLHTGFGPNAGAQTTVTLGSVNDKEAPCGKPLTSSPDIRTADTRVMSSNPIFVPLDRKTVHAS